MKALIRLRSELSEARREVERLKRDEPLHAEILVERNGYLKEAETLRTQLAACRKALEKLREKVQPLPGVATWVREICDAALTDTGKGEGMTPMERAILTVEKFSRHSAIRTGGTPIEDVTEYFEKQIVEAIREEREACAKIAWGLAFANAQHGRDTIDAKWIEAEIRAQAIRARTDTGKGEG
jgi:hypothetical protein